MRALSLSRSLALSLSRSLALSLGRVHDPILDLGHPFCMGRPRHAGSAGNSGNSPTRQIDRNYDGERQKKTHSGGRVPERCRRADVQMFQGEQQYRVHQSWCVRLG